MKRDWLNVIKEQGEIVKTKTMVATAMLADPVASLEMVSRLYRDVEEKARQFDATFLELSEDLGFEGPCINEAMEIQRLWSSISSDVADRVRTLGLMPTEYH